MPGNIRRAKQKIVQQGRLLSATNRRDHSSYALAAFLFAEGTANVRYDALDLLITQDALKRGHIVFPVRNCVDHLRREIGRAHV